MERLMDFEEKVRSSAVASLCEAAAKSLQVPMTDPTFAAWVPLHHALPKSRLVSVTLVMVVFYPRMFWARIADACTACQSLSVQDKLVRVLALLLVRLWGAKGRWRL
jgi:hypothetical protein